MDLKQLFKHYLLKNFRAYCEKNNIEPTPENFTDYILKAEVVKETTLKRYTVKNDLHRAIRCTRNKTEAVEEVSARLGVRVQFVWEVSNRYATEFCKV